MKNILTVLILCVLVTGCSIGVNDDGVNIDGGDLGSIKVDDDGVSIDGGDLGSIDVNDDGVNLDGGEIGSIKVNDDGVIMEDGEKNNAGVKPVEKEIIKKIDIDDYQIKVESEDGKVLLEMDDYQVRVYTLEGNRLLIMDEYQIEINDLEGNIIYSIDDYSIDNTKSTDEIIDFGDITRLGNAVTFKSDSLIIGTFEFKKDGIYNNGKKIGGLDQVKKSEDIYISNNKISFSKDIYITKDEIRYNESFINKDKKQFKDN